MGTHCFLKSGANVGIPMFIQKGKLLFFFVSAGLHRHLPAAAGNLFPQCYIRERLHLLSGLWKWDWLFRSNSGTFESGCDVNMTR
jgi:hypothetical protein